MISDTLSFVVFKIETRFEIVIKFGRTKLQLGRQTRLRETQIINVSAIVVVAVGDKTRHPFHTTLTTG